MRECYRCLVSFQLTRSRGAWQICDWDRACYRTFQLTRSRGAWRWFQRLKPARPRISTHTLTWSVTAVPSGLVVVATISTHTLTWSVTITVLDDKKLYKISTHTLTWSVTESSIMVFRKENISTHTLTWSVTVLSPSPSTWGEFQLTRSRGAWRGDNMPYTEAQKISTHTLTWSVTFGFGSFTVIALFQLTRSRGAWRGNVFGKDVSMNFNSHAHVERDIGKLCLHLSPWDFNSHAHVERDTIIRKGPWQNDNISTHTLTWSVTVSQTCEVQTTQHFNSHAHVERDLNFV